MLPKKYKLPAKDFRYVYTHGSKFRGKYGMLIVSPSTLSSRFGFVINKKIGNAVQRHRMTRLLRVVMMELTKELNLNSYKLNFQYVAFEFCNVKNDLETEVKEQIKSAIKYK